MTPCEQLGVCQNLVCNCKLTEKQIEDNLIGQACAKNDFANKVAANYRQETKNMMNLISTMYEEQNNG
jgi:hypothetical protein